MRVTHVVEAALGGVARYLLDWVRSSASLDLDQHLIYSEGRIDRLMEEVLELAAASGWTMTVIPAQREVDIRRDLGAVRAVSRELRAQPASDVVHLHSSKAGFIGRIALAANRSTRVIYSPHALALESRLHRTVELGLAMPPLIDAFGAITTSEQVQINETINRRWQRPVFVVPPAMAHVPRNTRVQRAQNGRPLIVGSGRMVAQKDPHEFVKVLSRLIASGIDVQGRWIGDGDDRGSVEALAASLGVNNAFEITGWLDNPLTELGKADIFLSTSRFESFGYVTAEAMMLGVPAIATAVPGTRSLAGVDGSNCLMYDVGDTEKATGLIVETLDAPAATENRIAAARTFVEATFTLQNMASSMMAAYTGTSTPS